jgi:hypothetical protein
LLCQRISMFFLFRTLLTLRIHVETIKFMERLLPATQKQLTVRNHLQNYTARFLNTQRWSPNKCVQVQRFQCQSCGITYFCTIHNQLFKNY